MNQHESIKLCSLPPELKIQIISYLTLIDMHRMCLQSRTWKEIVEYHMATCKVLDFNQEEHTQDGRRLFLFQFTIDSLQKQLSKVPSVEILNGFYPFHHLCNCTTKWCPYRSFVVAALETLKNLRIVEINCLRLWHEIDALLPSVKIKFILDGHCGAGQMYLNLPKSENVKNIRMNDCFVNLVPNQLLVEHLDLTRTSLSDKGICKTTFWYECHNIGFPELKSFKMTSDCPGDLFESDYPLLSVLANSPKLEELHFINIQHITWPISFNYGHWSTPEQNWSPVSEHLETLCIQTTLCDDQMMKILRVKAEELKFSSLKHLVLGYEDENIQCFPPRSCKLTDKGMRAASTVFYSEQLRFVEIKDCPMLKDCSLWTTPNQGKTIWRKVEKVRFTRCQSISSTCESFQQMMRQARKMGEQ